MPKPASPGKSDQAPGQVKKAPTFQYVQILAPGADGTGPDSAAVTAALNAGYRPTGAPRVESRVERADGVEVTWAVPVGAV